ncbi:ABC transporter substrate-binding protein/permease [Caviibacter abscessus]|uniref:ABC transporter substrate-binding protein/permease n=1 Tax=Caviibacter abscessus TaxID=1766719 RepID=UPI00083427C3|nr:ABC transporter substrate-binding protein/permease [Caviibacter abscessus]
MKKLIVVLITTISIIINAEGTLRVGMEVGYAPFNWYQKDDKHNAVKIPSGYANGYDVQIAKLIAEKLGKKLVIVPSDWDSLLGPALNSSKIDLVIAGMSPTLERRKSIDFTKSYYESDIVVVVKKDSKYNMAKRLNDFRHARITGQLNTLHYGLIKQLKGAKKQVAMENFPAMIVALNSNKIDGYIAENPSALSASFSDPNITFIKFKDNGFEYDKNEVNVAIGVKKGNIKLLNEVNRALSEIPKEVREKLMEDAIKNQPLSSSKENIQNNGPNGFFSWVKYILINYGNRYLLGTLTTVYLAIIGTSAGFIIGLIVALVNTVSTEDSRRKVHNIIYKILKKLNWIYISVFRGTPMIVQAMIFYYGLGQVFDINLSPIVAAMIIISINTGAYLSEIIRGGIESVDKGQYDAAQSLGFTHRQSMIYIILPQAIRNILPSVGNEFIINIKDSAVLFAIGVTELYTVSKQIAGTNFRYYEVFIITCVIYFVLTTVLSKILKYIEVKMDGSNTYEIVE